MVIQETRRCWQDFLKRFQEFGFTKDDIKFDIVQHKANIKITLSVNLVEKVRGLFKNQKNNLGRFTYLESYFKKKPRGKNFNIIIKKKDEYDVLGIQYLISVVLRELLSQREKEAIREQEKAAAAQAAEKKRKEAERKMKKERESRRLVEIEEYTSMIEKALLEKFSQREVARITVKISCNAQENVYYLRISFAKIRRNKKNCPIGFKASESDPRQFVDKLRDLLTIVY